MGTTLSTLSNLAIYIGLVVVGAFLGSRKALRSRPLVWVGKLQFAALMILIVTLGVNLGANDEVVSSLGQIGLAALVITVLAMAGSLLCLTLLRRFVLKLDHYGLPRGSEAAREEEAHHGGKADNSLTFIIVIAVVLGMLAGRFVLPAAVTAHCGTVISFGLYLLLFMVGMDMGKQGTLLADIKTAGFQVLLVPVAVCAGSLAFAALAGLVLPLGVKDSMAAASGLGWYSLAPTLLAPYSLSVSAVAFLSNVMRESSPSSPSPSWPNTWAMWSAPPCPVRRPWIRCSPWWWVPPTSALPFTPLPPAWCCPWRFPFWCPPS